MKIFLKKKPNSTRTLSLLHISRKILKILNNRGFLKSHSFCSHSFDGSLETGKMLATSPTK